MKKIGVNILGYNSKLAKTFIIQYKDLFKIKKFNINTIQNNEYIINFVGSTKKVKLLNSNYYYPKKILSKIIKNDIKICWIQISSLSVYNYNFKIFNKINDKTKPNPSTKYGISKNLFDQYLIKLSSDNKKFSYLILRPGSIIFDNEVKLKRKIKFFLNFNKFEKNSYFQYIYNIDLVKIINLLIEKKIFNKIILANNNLDFFSLQSKNYLIISQIGFKFKYISNFFKLNISRFISFKNYYVNSDIIRKNIKLKKIIV